MIDWQSLALWVLGCAQGLLAGWLLWRRPNLLTRMKNDQCKHRWVTIPVSNDIDKIRDRLAADTGITMTYSQVFNFLIHFYVERASEPKSKWRSLT
jgi:hypothetical protein